MNFFRGVKALTSLLVSDRTSAAAAAARVIHFNHAGASPPSPSTLETVISHLRQEHILGGYAAQDAVEDQLAAVYANAASLISASSPSEIALVESATTGWTRLFYSFATHQEQNKHSKEKIILVSEAEYAAMLVAACQWSRTHPGWSVLAIPSARETHGSGVQSTGKVDLGALSSMLAGTYRVNGNLLDPRTIALVCITHVPTNSGIINPVVEIGQQIADYNGSAPDSAIFYLADTCQSIGQLELNVQEMQCSGLVATGRKYLRGPRGTGFLYVPNELSNLLWPHHVDHYGVPVTSIPPSDQIYDPIENLLEFAPRAGARRFEFWESNVAGRLGLGQALAEVLEQGQPGIEQTIRARTRYLCEKLSPLDGLRIHHLPACGIVTFQVAGLDSAVLARELDTPVDGVTFAVSVVPATSTPLDTAATGVPNLMRASVSYTTTNDEIDLFSQRLERILLHL
jgi:selenocysteine lyase/cysteine desulfurase